MRKQDVEKWAFGTIGIRKEAQVKNRVNRIDQQKPYKRFKSEQSFKEIKEIAISKKRHDRHGKMLKYVQIVEDHDKTVRRQEMYTQLQNADSERALNC